MKLSVRQKNFMEGINTVRRAVSKKKTLPILNGIFMETKKDSGGLHLIATDLELGIECWVEADVSEEGSIVLPADHLVGIIRELPDKIINIDVNESNFRAKIDCLTSEFVINGYNPEEFPSLPRVEEPEQLHIEAVKFKSILEEVKFSTASEETQPALTGALLILEDEVMKMIATNTYRLSYSRRKIEEEVEGRIEVIIPGSTISELINLLPEEGNIEVLLNTNYTSFKFAGIKVISRLIEGDFPNYKQVMPDNYRTSVKINRKSFQKATKRASLIARQDANVISIKVKDDKMVINSVESETGRAHEELSIEAKGEEQEINIDAGYLLDVLKIIKEDDINIELIGPLNPLTVKRVDEQEEFIYLIMPVRPDS